MKETILELAGGNPGALSVLCGVAQRPDAGDVLRGLQQLDLRGSGIWIAFKDHCREDLDRFAAKALDCDRAMVEAVQQELGR